MLVGAPLAGAAHAGLNLIDDKQRPGGVGQRTCLGKEFLRERPNATFTLDGLDQDGANLIGEFRA
jgi:hypothetical protein